MFKYSTRHVHWLSLLTLYLTNAPMCVPSLQFSYPLFLVFHPPSHPPPPKITNPSTIHPLVLTYTHPPTLYPLTSGLFRVLFSAHNPTPTILVVLSSQVIPTTQVKFAIPHCLSTDKVREWDSGGGNVDSISCSYILCHWSIDLIVQTNPESRELETPTPIPNLPFPNPIQNSPYCYFYSSLFSSSPLSYSLMPTSLFLTFIMSFLIFFTFLLPPLPTLFIYPSPFSQFLGSQWSKWPKHSQALECQVT